MESVKDKVMAIYPNAVCYCWAGEYCIFKTGRLGEFEKMVLGHGSKQYSGWHKSENKAWSEAWEWIQDIMVEKFGE